MRCKRPFPLLVLIAALTLLPPSALGQEIRNDPPASYADTTLGAWAAIGCGIMVRATLVTGGTQVGTIAGAVACCGYMLFDALVVEQN
jgi:hypothetical protein